jgi:hypothetical protein
MNTHWYVLLQFSCGHIKDSSFRMCVPKCPTKSLSFGGLWFLTVWTKKIVYADILYFVEHVFSWNVACEKGKPPEAVKVLYHPSILKFGSPLWIKYTLHMLDVRIDTVKIFTTNSTYHCEMHFGTTVAYRRTEKSDTEIGVKILRFALRREKELFFF